MPLIDWDHPDHNLVVEVTPDAIREIVRDWDAIDETEERLREFVHGASDATLRDLAEGLIDKLWDAYHDELPAAVAWYADHPEHWKEDHA